MEFKARNLCEGNYNDQHESERTVKEALKGREREREGEQGESGRRRAIEGQKVCADNERRQSTMNLNLIRF